MFVTYSPVPEGVRAVWPAFPDVVGMGRTVEEADEDLGRQVDPLIVAAHKGVSDE